MMPILSAGIVLAVIGLIFGLVLTFASKKFHVDVDERVTKVRECCAGANCGACGFPGCDGFAAAVVKGEAPVNGCAPAGEAGAKKIAEIMGVTAETGERMVARVLCQGSAGIAKERYLYDGYKSCMVASGIAGGPKQCRFSCIGLGDCMAHCAFGAIKMYNGLCKKNCPADAITVENGFARIDPDKCIGCGKCASVCPSQAITDGVRHDQIF